MVWRGIPPIFPDAVVQSAWFSVVLLHLDATRTSFWVRGEAVGLNYISVPSERLQAQLTGRVGRILDRGKLNQQIRVTGRPTDGHHDAGQGTNFTKTSFTHFRFLDESWIIIIVNCVTDIFAMRCHYDNQFRFGALTPNGQFWKQLSNYHLNSRYSLK